MLTAIGGTAEMSLRILELQDEIADLRKKLEDRDEELKTRQDEVLCLSGTCAALCGLVCSVSCICRRGVD